MPTAKRLVKSCLFGYVLIFGILAWMFRWTIFKNDEFATFYRNRKLGYNTKNSSDKTQNTPTLNGGKYFRLTVEKSVKLHQRPTIHHSVAIREGKGSRTSFYLWKSIKLHPEDKRGTESSHRYGEPLQLYMDPRNTLSAVRRTNKKWQFLRQSNKLIDCESLFLKDKNVSDGLQGEITNSIKKTYNESLIQTNLSCEEYVRNAGYVTDSLTQMETEFPIAYSILMYTDVEQVEILLKTIYRPQNVYCIHVDKKSPRKLHDDIKTISNCFQNVFVTSYSIDVRWGTFSILEAETICLKDLWKNKVKWKYFINLTGQDFPLRTNFELVKILRSFNGANNVNAARLIKGLQMLRNTKITGLKKAGPPPYKLTPVIGSTHVVLSREFVDFLLHNETSLAYLNWTKNIPVPDEKYFSTMNYNKQLKPPGGYKGEPKTSATNPHLGRLKHWHTSSCHGKFVHSICIFGTKDLPLLATREELFVNKLHFGYHPEVMLCMQELLYNRTIDEYEGRLEFNITYYATRDFVNNKF